MLFEYLKVSFLPFYIHQRPTEEILSTAVRVKKTSRSLNSCKLFLFSVLELKSTGLESICLFPFHYTPYAKTNRCSLIVLIYHFHLSELLLRVAFRS